MLEVRTTVKAKRKKSAKRNLSTAFLLWELGEEEERETHITTRRTLDPFFATDFKIPTVPLIAGSVNSSREAAFQWKGEAC